MPIANKRTLLGALALSLGLMTGACTGGMPTNQSLYSIKQPVVERTNFTFDVQSGASGLALSEQRRLAEWFDTMQLAYGDRLVIDDPVNNPSTRQAIAELAEHRGIILSEGTAPVTSGFIRSGQVRVVLTRSKAHVPGCPDWSAKSDMNYGNATSPGYGCAVNSNLAAMVANPEDLISGQKGTGQTVLSTSTKAITSYREKAPTGEGGLSNSGTGGN